MSRWEKLTTAFRIQQRSAAMPWPFFIVGWFLVFLLGVFEKTVCWTWFFDGEFVVV
jgi:hypothetical protein